MSKRSPAAAAATAVRVPRKRRVATSDAAPTASAADLTTPAAVAAPVLVSVPPAHGCHVAHADLKGALARLASVADKKATMPILGHVAMRSKGAELELVATDLTVYLSIRIPTAAGSTAFGTTVNAHKVCALVKTLPGGDTVACEPSEAHLKIASGRVSARIASIPDRDFPKIPADPERWTSADAHALRNAIDATLFSTCNDETRFHLAGALMECDGRMLTMVTTDGHRLTRYHAPWQWEGGSLATGILIPRKGLTECRKLLGNASTCEIALEAPFLFIRAGNETLRVKLTDAQFPPYRQVIPTDNRRLVTVESAALTRALERAKLITCETRGVRLEIASGRLTVASDNPELGDMSESMDADYHGDSFRWGVNPTYLLQLIGEIGATSITIACNGELDPVLVRSTVDAAMAPLMDATILGVVMPMRI